MRFCSLKTYLSTCRQLISFHPTIFDFEFVLGLFTITYTFSFDTERESRLHILGAGMGLYLLVYLKASVDNFHLKPPFPPPRENIDKVGQASRSVRVWRNPSFSILRPIIPP